jgi:succinylglutamate desuccinylase
VKLMSKIVHRGGTGGSPQESALGREVGRYDSGLAGPLFVAVGGLHGNEPAGISAAEAVLERLLREGPTMRGRFVALRGNRAALGACQRYIERDLNRIWTQADLVGLKRDPAHLDGPDEGEVRGLVDAFADLFHEPIGGLAPREVILLDLHSTSGPSTPFLCMADTLQNRRVAFALGVPVILGLEEALEGTLLDFMSEAGHIAMAFEGGAHQDAETVPCHEAAIWCGLVAGGLLEPGAVELERHEKLLERLVEGAPEIVEVLYRHGTRGGDGFTMDPGWANFQVVHRGQRVAADDDGEIDAPLTGRLLLPRYQSQGDDGFFLARSVRPFWLGLSASLRRLGVERLLPFLPGVKRLDGSWRHLRVDRRKALFGVRQIFHLCGYRRFKEDPAGFVFVRRPDNSAELERRRARG